MGKVVFITRTIMEKPLVDASGGFTSGRRELQLCHGVATFLDPIFMSNIF